MCGILVRCNSKRPIDKKGFELATATLTHRGPDGCGVFLSADGLVGLGHRRLALVGLDQASSQPLWNEAETIAVVFNGEIYNHVELRIQLERLGHQFRSKSDTEVLVHGYEQWGEELLSHLEGMFAFTLFDTNNNRVFAARDRWGIKPLYFSEDAEGITIASELKAIAAFPSFKRTLNQSAVADFFVYRYIPSPKTIWNEAQKCEPGHSLSIDLNRGTIPTIKRYWQPHFDSRVVPAAVAESQFEFLLRNAVRSHLQGDTAVGGFLSGGYDSSLLTVLAAEDTPGYQSFGIGFDGWSESEHQYAAMVAAQCGSRFTPHILDASSISTTPQLASVYDEPLADISIIPTYLVSKATAHQVKSILSGEGADELCVGYWWQRPTAAAFSEGFENGLTQYAEAMAMGNFGATELRSLLGAEFHREIPKDPLWFYRQQASGEFPHPMKRAQWLDLRCFMGELVLAKVDRASMANSLEARVPFLDTKLSEYLMTLAPSVYAEAGRTKPLIAALLKSRVPESILARKKQGFVGPDTYYQNFSWYEQILTKSRAVSEGVLLRRAIEELLAKRDHWRLWKSAVFSLWYEQWM